MCKSRSPAETGAGLAEGREGDISPAPPPTRLHSEHVNALAQAFAKPNLFQDPFAFIT